MSSASYAINRLNETINSFQDRVSQPLNGVYQSSENVNSTTTQIYNGIQKFQQDMMKGEETQLAQENIIRIDQILKEQFADHEEIRKTVIGIVRDFDVNLVRNSTIQELSEELWITSSRYWLSYALIAITAWVNNYPETAKNALAESGRRDSIKTTLFFTLMNLRFRRMKAAKLWFCEYLKTLDPSMLQQETAVLLEAFLNGIFGVDKELENEVLDRIDEWMRIINEDAAACEDLINQYVTYINNLKCPASFNYSSIQQFCAEQEAIRKSYQEVSKYDSLTALINSLDVEAVEQNEDNYKERVDAVLISLISRYDEDELVLRNQQMRFRFIIEQGGDVSAAEHQYEQLENLQSEGFNIGKQMVRWAVFDSSEATNEQVRKFGFQNTRQWFIDALNRWDTRLHQEKPVNYTLNIDTWTGVSNGYDHAEQEENMRNYFETNKFRNMFINTPNIALLLVIIISAGLAFVTIYSLVATILGLGGLAFMCVRAIKAYPLRVNAAVENLNKVMAEIADYNDYYAEKRALKNDLINRTNFI